MHVYVLNGNLAQTSLWLFATYFSVLYFLKLFVSLFLRLILYLKLTKYTINIISEICTNLRWQFVVILNREF